MGHKIRTIYFKHRLKYKQEHNDYVLQMRRKRSPWWLLLLLLALLFVKCSKDITVTCVDADTLVPVEEVPVSMSYQAHFLWNEGKLLDTQSISMTQTTDSVGQTVFRDLPCSVYSYIFYCLSRVTFSAKNECYAAIDKKFNFHYTRHAKLKMAPRLEDLHVRIVDSETGDLLPDATLEYRYKSQGEEFIDSVKTDASGVATIPQMRYCSTLDVIKGSHYGYADTLKTDIPCQSIYVANDSATLRLRPLKERFTFFVKDKDSKEPIPDAICSVVLTSPTGKASAPRTVRTSIDGKGIAVYDNAFVLSTIDITATKQHYKDGKLEGGPWTVDAFIKQDEETRTVWLDPEPYLVGYINVDSINGKPISGVRNEIKVTDTKGNSTEYVETSNMNGVFPVTAKENSKIEIKSIKSPLYKTKETLVPKFKDKEVIKMMPVFEKVKLRTVVAKNGHPLLPQCSLNITGSVSGHLKPTNSGDGVFEVEGRLNDNISIVASKKNYATNNTTVKNEPLPNLQAGRDIPLKHIIDIRYSKDIKGVSRECYDLEEAPITFDFTWNMCVACSMIKVIDGNGTIIGRFGVDAPNGDGNGTRFSPSSGRTTLRSNTRNVCVEVTNVNGHVCTYEIKGK
jgi:hypothetical protein